MPSCTFDIRFIHRLSQTGVSCNPQSGPRSDQNFASIADTSVELCRSRHLVSILFHGRIFQTDLAVGALHLPHKVSTLGHAKAYQFPNRSCPQAQTGKAKMAVIPNTSKEKVFHFPRIDTKARR